MRRIYPAWRAWTLFKEEQTEVPYHTYNPFDFQSITSVESYINFRFWKKDILRVKVGLRIHNVITTYKGMTVSGTEAFCLLLRQHAYQCCLSDIGREFVHQSISNFVCRDQSYA